MTGTQPARRARVAAWWRRLAPARKWLLGVAGTLIVAGLTTVLTTVIGRAFQSTPRTIALGTPNLTLQREGDHLQSLGIPAGDTPPADLRRRGLAIAANIDLTGYRGRRLPLVCTLSDQTTGAVLQQRLTIDGDAQVTTPCWIALPPGGLRHRYEGTIAVLRADGDPTPLKTSAAGTFQLGAA